MRPDPALARLTDAILIPPFRGTAAPSWLLAALAGGLGGVTLFGFNVASPGQLARLTGQLREAGGDPVIAIDEEGGDVTRLSHLTGSPYPGNAALGIADDTGLTRTVYRAMAADLAAAGINLDLAPSVDVNAEDTNPIIGTRSFGADPELVARHAAAAVTGLQAGGIAACAKHFPGHGSTREDSHHTLATVTGGMAALRRRDLPPFRAAISAGVMAVMPGHLRVPGLTGHLPATLSHAALTGLLRGELRFTGLIVSDALEMRAVSGPYGITEAAVKCLAAGVDLLCLGAQDGEQAYRAVRAAVAGAVADGRVPAQRLEEAADRVGRLRRWLAAAPERRAVAGGQPGGFADGADPGLTAARRAVQLTGLPGELRGAVVVEVEPPATIVSGAVPWGLGPWLPEDAELLRLRLQAGAADGGAAGTESYAAASDAAAAVLERAAGRPLLVVVRDAHRQQAARELVSGLLAARPDATVAEMGLPVWRPLARSYLATYGAGRANGQAAAELLGFRSSRR